MNFHPVVSLIVTDVVIGWLMLWLLMEVVWCPLIVNCWWPKTLSLYVNLLLVICLNAML